MVNKESTDQEIINFMSESMDVNHWNERREIVKEFRNQLWITKNLDMSGLIIKFNIPKNKRIPENETLPSKVFKNKLD